MKLFVAGSNAQGQLATGDTEDVHQFTQVPLPPEVSTIIQIACGANHTLMLANSGLYGSGDGKHGQLASITSCTTFRPIKLPFDSKYTIRLIACSWESSYIVFSTPGTADLLVAIGANDFGAQGVLSPSDYNVVPIPIQGEYRIKKLVAGPRHVVVILTVDNKTCTLGWGASRHGQLGEAYAKQPFCTSPVIISDEPILDTAVGFYHTVLLHCDGYLLPLGSNKKHQLEGMSSLKGVRALGCTWNGTYAITDDAIHATGSNSHCQLPDSSLLPVPPHSDASFICGSEHVLYSTDGSIVLGWGWNEHGNLGQGHTSDVAQPQRLLPDKHILGVWAGCGTSWVMVE